LFKVSLTYSILTGAGALTLAQCRNLIVAANWGYRLAKFGISFREAFRGSSDHRQRLLPVLAHSTAVRPWEIREYIEAFAPQELEGNLVLCVKCLILPADSTTNFSFTPLSVDVAVKRADAIADMIVGLQCIVVVGGMSDVGGCTSKSGLLVEMLAGVVSRLDACDYEQIEFVLRHLRDLRPTSKVIQRNHQVLACLTSYRSVKAGSDDSGGRGRVSFHGLIGTEQWEIITAELNEETIDVWLPICAMLELKADNVVMTTIRNVVRDYANATKRLDASNSSEPSSAVGLDVSSRDTGGDVSVVSRDKSWKRGGDGKDRKRTVRELFKAVRGLLSRLQSHEKLLQSVFWIVSQMNSEWDQVRHVYI